MQEGEEGSNGDCSEQLASGVYDRDIRIVSFHGEEGDGFGIVQRVHFNGWISS